MWPSFIHFFIPFQYCMCAIALVKRGHHCTFPTVSFLLFISACFLASVLSRSISSYSHCCFLVSQLCLTCFVTVSMHLGSWCTSSCSCSASLYLWMMRGSVHFNLLTRNGTDSGVINHPSAANGRSTHTAR